MNESTLVFIDAGFLSKLSKYFGDGKYISYDLIKFAKKIATEQNLFCKHIYYYTSPPFQCSSSEKNESTRTKRYERFIEKLSKTKEITIREGRCQRLKVDGKNIYKQKGVDSLMVMDMVLTPLNFKDVNKIILIASDSDFVPVVNELSRIGIKTLLYTYFIRKRNTPFSRSNYLLTSVTKYFKLNKNHFSDCLLN